MYVECMLRHKLAPVTANHAQCERISLVQFAELKPNEGLHFPNKKKSTFLNRTTLPTQEQSYHRDEMKDRTAAEGNIERACIDAGCEEPCDHDIQMARLFFDGVDVFFYENLNRACTWAWAWAWAWAWC